VNPQDLDVGDEETAAFDRRHDFGQGGHIAAGKNIFRDPGIGRPRPIRPADGVNESDPVLVEQRTDLPEEQVVMGKAHMFEHADRDDAVEAPIELAVIAKPEIGCSRKAEFRGAGTRDAKLRLRKRDAGYARAAEARQINRHPAKATADIKDALARLDQKFRRDMAFFGELGAFEILAVTFEIGAGILQP
jgi:hypothetical protein